MTTQTLHFTVDPYWLIGFMLQQHHGKHYDRNEDHPKAVRYALSDLLYGGADGLTNDELYQIAEKYFGKGVDTFMLDATEEQAAGLFKYVLEIPRYADKVWEYTLQGYGKYEYSVLDLKRRIEYETSYAEHYSSLLKVLSENYADDFNELMQEEKDKFIMENFKLIGKSYSMDWYTPKYPVWEERNG